MATKHGDDTGLVRGGTGTCSLVACVPTPRGVASEPDRMRVGTDRLLPGVGLKCTDLDKRPSSPPDPPPPPLGCRTREDGSTSGTANTPTPPPVPSDLPLTASVGRLPSVASSIIIRCVSGETVAGADDAAAMARLSPPLGGLGDVAVEILLDGCQGEGRASESKGEMALHLQMYHECLAVLDSPQRN